MSDRETTNRGTVSISLLALAMVGLGVRLAFLHIGTEAQTRSSVSRRGQIQKTLLAGRGSIYDCKGRANILALNLSVKDVCADPAVIMQSNCVPEVASQLAELLQLPTDEVAVRLSRADRRFAYIKRYVDEDASKRLAEAKLYGVFFRNSTMRHYPQGRFLCHVLGFANYDGVGSAGIEQYVDSYLKGSPGILEGRVNALRQEMYTRRDRYVPALEGANITLTIDQNVQFIVETALDQALQEYNAKGAWAIVQHIRTGEILAMASRPAFDPNEFRSVPPDQMLNRAIGLVYEPGSTMKAATLAAALDLGLVSSETVFDCENGAWSYGGRILHDSHAYDRLSVADGIKKSSNILAAKVAVMLGDQQLHRYFKAFGLGSKLGIDLPGEENGILHPTSNWSRLSATRMAIGQGVAVTALQMLGVYCAIANDGCVMRPYVIRSVHSADGEILLATRPEVISRAISLETATLMRRLLARVTEEGGTGKRACVEGFQVAGKTGTAQKAVNGGYSDTAYVGSFVGFLPADNPEVGIIVVIDEPEDMHTGGRVAAPAFSQIAEQTVRYLNVPSTHRMIAQTGRGAD